MKQGIKVILLVILSILALVGCGGSSSSSSSSVVDLFITDNLNPTYSGVWVKLYKAELKNTSDGSVKLFESVEGLPVNLRQLNDGANRFLFLAPGSVPAGTYKKVEFLVDKTVNLVATPSGTASTAVFPTSMDSGTGQTKLDLDLSPNVTIPGPTRLTVDFDLSRWTVAGGIITPVLGLHNGNGLDDASRHERFEFKGTVSDLSGPLGGVQVFKLNLRFGGAITVNTDEATDIVGEGIGASVANGRKVEVYGNFNPTNRSILATVIRVESENENEAKAIGPAMIVDATAGTLKIQPKFTRGFSPAGEFVNVSTNSTTRYKGRRGAILTKAQFFAAFTISNASPIVQVEGAFSSATNTIVAKSLHIENEVGFGEAEAKGSTSAPDAVAGRFSLSPSEISGFSHEGTLTVEMLGVAEYSDQMGESISRETFFGALSNRSRTVDVKGSYANGKLTARRARIRG